MEADRERNKRFRGREGQRKMEAERGEKKSRKTS
mgnify:CR=1 FL=1